MILYSLLILSSLLLGSSFGQLIAKMLVFQKGLNLFKAGLAQNIPSFSSSLAQAKSLDLTEFSLSIILSFTIFFVLFILYRQRKYNSTQQIVIGLIYSIFAFFIFITTLFASYSGTQVILFSIIWCTVILVISFFTPKQTPSWQESKRAVFNGIIMGFYALIVLHNVTTSIALPLAVFVSLPLYFYLFSGKIRLLNHPAFVLLIFSFILPFNKAVLAGITLLTALFLFLTRNKIPQKLLIFMDKVYPIIILFIFLYNPLFYSGNFDSVEEGFWAGWLERLLNGQVIYRNFAAYQPPFLLYGLYIFTKAFGLSLYYFRLYFHILQILGLIIIYFVLNNIVKPKWLKIGIFALILSYCLGLVRNNIEIRVGAAVFPLLFVYWYHSKKQGILLFLAGVLSALSFFISSEVGVASLIATSLIVILSSTKETVLKNLVSFIVGLTTVSLPVLGIFTVNGSLNKFLGYMTYFISTFSNGYMNAALDRPDSQTLLQWYQVNKFVSSSGFLFILSEFSIIATVCVVFIKKVYKNIVPRDILALGLTIFALVLSRSALGRSDSYHITFVWIVALLLIGYLLQLAGSFSKSIPIVILCILILYVGRDSMQNSLLQNQFIKFETYSNPSGSYPSYSIPREGIITGIDVNPGDTDSLVRFIDSNVSKNEPIFVFPQEPELYFLTDRKNSTSFDTPLAFYTLSYQQQMVEELKINPPKLIIYMEKFSSAGFTNDTLHEVNRYILDNYKVVKPFGEEGVMVHK